MLQVPLSAIPSQTLSITLDGQPCTIVVQQRTTGVYFSLTFNGVPATVNVRCLNKARLMADRQYVGFVGDFMIWDQQGDTAPDYTGLGARYILIYLEAADLVGVGP